MLVLTICLPTPPQTPCLRTRVRRTSLGIKATNGVVLATEKKMSSPLMDPTSVQKICNLTDAAGIVYSGMGPDFRVLVKKGRKAAQQYFRVYQVRGGSGARRRCARTVPGGMMSGARVSCAGTDAALSTFARPRHDDAGIHAARVRAPPLVLFTVPSAPALNTCGVASLARHALGRH